MLTRQGISLERWACGAKHGGNGGTETRRDFGWSVCWRILRTRKTLDKRLGGTFLEVRSSSLQNLRVSFLRALRVLRRRPGRKESERACPMGGRSLSGQHPGQPPCSTADSVTCPGGDGERGCRGGGARWWRARERRGLRRKCCRNGGFRLGWSRRRGRRWR